MFAEAVQVFYSEADECWCKSHMTFLSGRLGNRLGTKPEHDPAWLDPARMTGAMYHPSHVWAVEQFLRLKKVTGHEAKSSTGSGVVCLQL